MFKLIAILMLVTSQTTLFDFSMKDIDGTDVPLSKYKGNVVLVVNVASYCGYTYQYEQLQALYKSRKDKGLVILAFPSNDYGAQEPGTNTEIKEFCASTFGVSFPLFEKITVKGEDKHPLYAWLTTDNVQGEVRWNFEKFLIGKSGRVLSRYPRETEPMTPEFLAIIDKALAEE